MRKRLIGLIAFGVALWFALGTLNTGVQNGPQGNSQGDQGYGQGDDGGTVKNTPTAPRPASSQVGFRSRERLEEHFAKHGREFGRLTIEDYLAKAQQLRDASLGGDVLEIIRKTDGVISRYDRSSGAFLAADSDGTIRTFFKPNDGEAYFRRQATRSATP